MVGFSLSVPSLVSVLAIISRVVQVCTYFINVDCVWGPTLMICRNILDYFIHKHHEIISLYSIICFKNCKSLAHNHVKSLLQGVDFIYLFLCWMKERYARMQ